MLKKLTSLLLSLLVCLSLLPGQAHAARIPEPVDPPAVVEPVEPETPEDPDAPPALAAMGDVPEDDDDHA